MEHQSVKSSNLKSVAYDPDTQTLEVAFKNGKSIYTYQGVSETEYNRLMQSRSKGTYFAQYIKNKPIKRGR